jgi:drug/metabolite transporter (DMT)-like permease
MGLLFGALAALFIGSSDFFAARSGRHAPAISVVRTAMVSAGLLTPVLFLVIPSHVIGRDLVIAAGSGVSMAIGLAMLYQGYRIAPIGIVGPSASVLLAVVPIVYDLVNGTTLKTLTAVGMVLGLTALGLTSYVRGGKGKPMMGFFLGTTSGILFGIAFTLQSRTKASGLTPVIAQRWAAFAALALMLPIDKGPLFTWNTKARWTGIWCGVFAGAGMACLQLGFKFASAGIVSVASSQFATVAVLLSVMFNKEHLRWWQTVGVTLTAVAVALMAAG